MVPTQSEVIDELMSLCEKFGSVPNLTRVALFTHELSFFFSDRFCRVVFYEDGQSQRLTITAEGDRCDYWLFMALPCPPFPWDWVSPRLTYSARETVELTVSVAGATRLPDEIIEVVSATIDSLSVLRFEIETRQH